MLPLDPGRIKRGLVGHDQAGYPLTEGVAVVVAVEGSFRDAARRPLLAAAERRYHVGAAVRAKVELGAGRSHRPAGVARTSDGRARAYLTQQAGLASASRSRGGR
jgi:hypothetical protein